MRRIELGYGLSITGERAGTVALVVYAPGAGGAALVAAYAARGQSRPITPVLPGRRLYNSYRGQPNGAGQTRISPGPSHPTCSWRRCKPTPK
jgi:hypothetical protein